MRLFVSTLLAAMLAAPIPLFAGNPEETSAEGDRAGPESGQESEAQSPADEDAERPSAEALLDAIDTNLTFDTRTARATMTVKGRRTRTYEMVTYARGEEDAAIEYLSPARDRGTRMLKLGDHLSIYMPSIDRVQRISGHMMREGMMGSDVSYEDMMTSRELRDSYDAEVVGSEKVEGRATWKVEMTAHDESVTYPRRVTWVDKEHFIPIKQEMYALSGMLLKTWVMSGIEEVEEGRYFPMVTVIEDHVRQGSRTRIEFSDMRFGVELESQVFSRRWLERR